MKQLSGNFITAARDYKALLEKKYPQKAVFNLVATRYDLNATDRSVLYRGIHTDEKAASRRSKLTSAPDDIIHVDGYNVIITVSSYLSGNLVYLSCDSLLRDTSEASHSHLTAKIQERACQLILDYLCSSGLSKVNIYLDQSVDGSQELATFFKLKSDVHVIPSVDHLLIKLDHGTLATSDGQIVDHCCVPVFDLARYILKDLFNTIFIDLQNMLSNDQPAGE